VRVCGRDRAQAVAPGARGGRLTVRRPPDDEFRCRCSRFRANSPGGEPARPAASPLAGRNARSPDGEPARPTASCLPVGEPARPTASLLARGRAASPAAERTCATASPLAGRRARGGPTASPLARRRTCLPAGDRPRPTASGFAAGRASTRAGEAAHPAATSHAGRRSGSPAACTVAHRRAASPAAERLRPPPKPFAGGAGVRSPAGERLRPRLNSWRRKFADLQRASRLAGGGAGWSRDSPPRRCRGAHIVGFTGLPGKDNRPRANRRSRGGGRGSRAAFPSRRSSFRLALGRPVSRPAVSCRSPPSRVASRCSVARSSVSCRSPPSVAPPRSRLVDPSVPVRLPRSRLARCRLVATIQDLTLGPRRSSSRARSGPLACERPLRARLLGLHRCPLGEVCASRVSMAGR
jgi:hypothetical protein